MTEEKQVRPVVCSVSWTFDSNSLFPATTQFSDGGIKIKTTPETLTITDNGIGMTKEEVRKALVNPSSTLTYKVKKY